MGIAPVRRAAWSHKPFNLGEAVRCKEHILQYMTKYEKEDIEFITLENITQDGLLFRVSDAEYAAEYFVENKVDAVFIPHCNFGSEESAAVLCKRVGCPVLLWGPKDYINEEDLYRYRDSQCGLFATSKVLQMYGVEFSYIQNCDIEDAEFDKGFHRFIAAASVVKAMRSMRIGQISTRPAPFASVKCNEMELLEKFGIEILPITLQDLKNRMEKYRQSHQKEIEAVIEEFRSLYTMNGCRDQDLEAAAAFKLTIEEWAIEENLSAAVAMCWGPMIETIGIAPCFVMGDVCDDGFPFICEADIHGAVTSVLAMAASRYRSPVFLADMTIRHPTNPNAELMWHCGVFAKSLAMEGQDKKLSRHYNRLCPVVGEWELKKGRLNILRFDGINGKYSLFMGKAQAVDGPKTVGAYVWVEVDDWKKWEYRLIYGPYIHHCAGIYEEVREPLIEACRYIEGLETDVV